MRRWRIGTFSLGFLMVVLGVVMLIAQFKQLAILKMLFTLWPLILVLIGAEILVQVYTVKEQQSKIEYDVFSIFITLIIIFFSIGMYALTSIGLIERMAWVVESSVVSVEIPSQRVSVDDTLKKIVVVAPKGRLDIKKSSTPEVVVFGEAVVKTAGQKETGALAEQNKAITRREGDTLFVQMLSANWWGDFKPGTKEIQYTLLLPPDVEVEVSGPNYFHLDIDGGVLGGNWLIKGSGAVGITATHASDLSLDAQISSGNNFRGNANWEIEDKSDPQTTGGSKYEGHLKWGAGTNKVNIILDSGEIAVYEIV